MKTSEEPRSLIEEVAPVNRSPDELKQAAGGRPIDQKKTRMVCFSPGCDYTAIWTGDFYKKITECERCHQRTLEGVELI